MSRGSGLAGLLAGGSCLGFIIGILVLNLLLGGYCLNCTLNFVTGHTIGTFPAAIAGLFLGEFTIPSAVICWLLDQCHVAHPLLHTASIAMQHWCV